MDPLVKNNLKLNIHEYQKIDAAGGGWELYDDNVQFWAWRSHFFNKSELDAICNIGQELHLVKGKTSGDEDGARDSYVSFIFPTDNTFWLFQKMTDLIHEMNNAYFGFDLTSMEQGLQFTQYSAPGQHYSWHVDRGIGRRKLSFSIQLSDADEYEGGDLELWFGGKEPVKINRERGMIAAFPSFAMHRVTPVTKGTRKSLVCWVSGPQFK